MDIEIAGRTYPIIFEKLPKRLRPGYYDNTHKDVHLHDKLSESERTLTLLHEIDEIILHEIKDPAIDYLLHAMIPHTAKTA